MSRFLPKIFSVFQEGYSFEIFKKDLVAGLTVGVIALPLAMGFAIASGTTPDRGLYTAIIAGFLISLLGGSRVQIGGPTGAFVVIIYGIMQRTGYQGLCISTLIAAVLLILMGVFRVGSWIKYIPHAVVVGFTAGIAALIFSTQVKNFFGLSLSFEPAGFAPKWISYFQAFPTLDLRTFAVGGSSFALILLTRRYFPRLPWGIVAIVVSTIVCQVLGLDIPTVYSSFGEISRTLPMPTIFFSMPQGRFGEIMMDAIAIAILGGIESLLSAVIGDRMSGGVHRPNCELIAQGIANIGSILFGGIPATGAIARTAINVRSGAKTPIAGICHAGVLAIILFSLSPIVSKIPLASLAAVLIMVAWNMSERGEFFRLLSTKWEDRIVVLSGFFLTIFVDITAAIFGGTILAALLFRKKISDSSTDQVP